MILLKKPKKRVKINLLSEKTGINVDKNSRNFVIITGILACLLISVDRIKDFYERTFPIAFPGECIEIYFYSKSRPVEAIVLKNYPVTNTSLIGMKVGEGYTLEGEFTYLSLRKFNTEKVKCDEK
jgi:hypothetical protein